MRKRGRGCAHASGAIGAESGAKFGEAGQIASKDRFVGDAFLQTFKMNDMLRQSLIRQSVDDEVGAALRFDSAVTLEIAEVFGDFDLQLAQHGLKVTYAERAAKQRM